MTWRGERAKPLRTAHSACFRLILSCGYAVRLSGRCRYPQTQLRKLIWNLDFAPAGFATRFE